MILLALLLAGTPPTAASPEARYKFCVDQIQVDANAAAKAAEAWRAASGGWPASQCLGLAYVAGERWAPATAAFEQAAQQAEQLSDARAANLWVQAGNAALAGGDPSKARIDLDRAIKLATLSDAMAGEAWMDRARAGVALNDLPVARTDLDKALKLVPGDPMGWLLSATLARRQSDLARAAKDIAQAETRAPGDATIALEAGRIAFAAGDTVKAKAEWTRAQAADASGDVGDQAAALLAEIAPPPPAK